MNSEDVAPKRIRRDWLAIAGFVIAFLTLLAALLAVWMQLNEANQQLDQQAQIASAQYVLNLRNQLDSSKLTAIITAIENHPHTFSPLKAGFSTSQLENYMGQLETIGDLVRDDIIAPQMAYDEFSYDAEKAYCNVDVQKDIADARQNDATTGTDMFYDGFESMTLRFLLKDKLMCNSRVLDNQ
jgi:hypothetical protein